MASNCTTILHYVEILFLLNMASTVILASIAQIILTIKLGLYGSTRLHYMDYDLANMVYIIVLSYIVWIIQKLFRPNMASTVRPASIVWK